MRSQASYVALFALALPSLAMGQDLVCTAIDMSSMPADIPGTGTLLSTGSPTYNRQVVPGSCGTVPSGALRGFVSVNNDNTLRFAQPVQRLFVGLANAGAGDELVVGEASTITNICGGWYQIDLASPSTTVTIQDTDPGGGSGYSLYAASCIPRPGGVSVRIEDGSDGRLGLTEVASGVVATVTLPLGRTLGDVLEVDVSGNGDETLVVELTASQIAAGSARVAIPASAVPANGVLRVEATLVRGSLSGTTGSDTSVVDTDVPGDPTVFIEDGGDELLNAAEVAAGVTATLSVPANVRQGDVLTVDIGGDFTVDASIVLLNAQIGGTISIPIPAADVPSEGTLAVLAFIQDSAGNRSRPASDSSQVDTQAPLAPTVTLLDGGDGGLNAVEVGAGVQATIQLPAGTQAGDVVSIDTDSDGADDQTITLTAGQVSQGQVRVDVDPSDVPGNGTVVVSAFLTDVAGNEGPSDSDSATVDVTPASVPTVQINDGGDGTLNAEEVASGVTVSVGIPGDAQPGDTLLVDTNGDAIPDVTVVLTPDQIGNAVDLPVAAGAIPVTGTLAISAVIVDAVGNVSPSGSDSSVVDSVPPGAVVVSIVDGGDGILNRAEVTAGVQATIALPDNAQTGDVLRVDTDGDSTDDHTITLTGAQVSAGQVIVTVAADDIPTSGSLTVRALLTDPAGNEGGRSSDTVTVDRTAPDSPLVQIVDGGDGVLNAEEVDAGVTVDIGIPDTAQAGDTLLVDTNNDDAPDQTIVLTQDQIAGSLTLTIPAADVPTEGTLTVGATLVDPAGNIGLVGTDTVWVDTVAPLAPTVAMDDGGDGIDNDEAASGVLVDIDLPAGTEEGDILHVDTDGDGADDQTVTLTAGQAEAGVLTLTVDPQDVPTIGIITVDAFLEDVAGNVGPTGSDVVDRLCTVTDEVCDGVDGDCDGTVDGTVRVIDDVQEVVGACDDGDNDGLTDHDEVFGESPTDPSNPDTDADGIQDGTELGLTEPTVPDATDDSFIPDADPESTTDPNDDDSDDDGLLDGSEDLNVDGRVDTDETDPTQFDTDADNLSDGLESGLVEPEGIDTDLAVFVADADPETTTSPLFDDTDDGGTRDDAEDANLDGAYDPDLGECDPNDPLDDGACRDSDGDGLSDAVEDELGTDPNDDDTDNDGLTDDVEAAGDTDPTLADSDADGIQDGTELGLTEPQGTDTADGFVPDADPQTTTDPTNPDSDDDGLLDGEEDADGNGAEGPTETDPNDADTDDGGVSDGDEVERGTDPLDPADDPDVVPDEPDDVVGGDLVQGGCGCESGRTAAFWLALPLALLVLRRRRTVA